MTEFLYHYKITVTKVVDGDTIYGDVDLGFNVSAKKMEFRLAEVNTPEIKGENRTAGLASKKFVEDTLLNKEVCVLTKKDSKEKYGRYLAWVYYKEADNLWICLNKKLVELNLAVPFMV
jgi:micrococcal nuclease